jgi:hypothetical protein
MGGRGTPPVIWASVAAIAVWLVPPVALVRIWAASLGSGKSAVGSSPLFETCVTCSGCLASADRFRFTEIRHEFLRKLVDDIGLSADDTTRDGTLNRLSDGPSRSMPHSAARFFCCRERLTLEIFWPAIRISTATCDARRIALVNYRRCRDAFFLAYPCRSAERLTREPMTPYADPTF